MSSDSVVSKVYTALFWFLAAVAVVLTASVVLQIGISGWIVLSAAAVAAFAAVTVRHLKEKAK